MWEHTYLNIKSPKTSKALKQALDLSYKWLTSLVWLHSATFATFHLKSWAPLTNPGSTPEFCTLTTDLYPFFWYIQLPCFGVIFFWPGRLCAQRTGFVYPVTRDSISLATLWTGSHGWCKLEIVRHKLSTLYSVKLIERVAYCLKNR